MPQRPRSRSHRATPTMHFHLFGQVPFEDMLNVQRRLVYETASHEDGRITIMACEHEPVITIGRGGSRADILADQEELEQRQLEVQYVARGGGTVLHGPGQLALYVIAPLTRLRWTVGEYLRRLHSGLATALDELRVRHTAPASGLDLWGASGVLATLGTSLRHGIASFGVALNVDLDLKVQRRVLSIRGDRQARLGSLLTERPEAGRMAAVRSTLIATLPPAFGCQSCQVHSGHPLLPDIALDRELSAAA